MRKLLKLISKGIAVILVSPLILATWAGLYLLRSERIFIGCAQLVSLVPDYIGTYLRVAFYSFTLSECSFTGHIMFGSYISKQQTRIGRNFYIGAYNIIGLADIGANVVIANNISILSGRRQHNFDDPSRDIMDGHDSFNRLRIGNNVFIGDRTVIMADIGDHSIIGAGSIVVKEIPQYSVAVGNPARVVKERG
ncbi:MAG: acyltransferase [Candidatus Zixiibacteriota bacterium]